MLRIEALTKSFDGFMAVNNARLTVDQGEVVAVIGPNGAGKTTLFHLITGQLAPDSGSIRFQEKEIAAKAPHKICRMGIARSYQVVNLFSRLSVFENVQVAVLARRGKTFNLLRPSRTIAVDETNQILESVGLGGKADRVCGMLSHGEQKVLEIAIALGSRPEMLILDEPTAGMSPEETAQTLALMKRLVAEFELTILFCEHDMAMVFSIADRIMVMQQGQTLVEDTPEAVRSNLLVQEAYLGGGAAPC
ncbi:MAG: ABC transporter ATP-binding protein [Desulfobacterales bacterium]|nr:ABC transporter ATP-binding protein [Desulfobacterales bacterium]MCF8080371.1 ABC transporter ATP-binding protein [Desulfobacterales bacterium]